MRVISPLRRSVGVHPINVCLPLLRAEFRHDDGQWRLTSVRSIAPSLAEMAASFGASPWQAFRRIYLWAALPEILAGIRLGVIRSVKGVIIGQLLISIVGFGALFELYSANFLMSHFWAVLVVLFAMAFTISEFLAYLERRVSYYAAKR